MGISLQEVSYTYQVDTPFEGRALFGIDMTIEKGSYTALIGHTGSGKSTIVQLLNGLHIPTAGSVVIDEVVVLPTSISKDIKAIRQRVGLVFQFPENQLFEETVLQDVAFGPQNFGVPTKRSFEIAREKLQLVGISEDLFGRSPFELSGGQMRRVAIAGILAMDPDYLVLDEPTAGLDPVGRRELMHLFRKLHATGMTIVLVTHVMDDVADYADWVHVLSDGKLLRSDTPKSIFQEVDFLESIQLGVPKITKFAANLERRGYVFDTLPITVDGFIKAVKHG